MSAVSIIICTRNRADDLRLTLESANALCVSPDLLVELLIIDNGSTDDTCAVAKSSRLRDITIRYIFEGRKGLSIARNRALAEASGEILLWTDDDVRLPSDWIECMCRPILAGEADAVAGTILAERSRQQKIVKLSVSHWFEWDFAQTAEPGVLVGASMAFNRRVSAFIGGFDENLGAGQLGFGEDVLFSWQALSAGFRIANAGTCIVEHHFSLDRLSVESLTQRARQQGRVRAYLCHHWLHGKPHLSYLKRHLLHAMAKIIALQRLVPKLFQRRILGISISIIEMHSFYDAIGSICDDEAKYSRR